MDEEQAYAIARQISEGHAYKKHVVEGDDFPEIKSREEFADLIHEAITDRLSLEKSLDDGRQAFWSERRRTLVIIDWWSRDGGTALRPRRGRAYFRQLE